MISYIHSLLNPIRNIIPGTLLHACIIIILMLITTSFISSAACAPDIYVNQTGWYRSGGEFNISSTPIQAAVNSATAGNMIYVYSGTYKENVNVDRRLTLQGEGADVVDVTGVTSGHVFWVTADYVNISGFSLSGAHDDTNEKAGIYLDSADHCNIFNNNVLKNGIGIYLDSSKNNILMNNTANSNQYGIYLGSSSNNTLTNNNANSNDGGGIRLFSSSNNTFTNNTVKSNGHGIWLYSSSDNFIYNNYFNNTINALEYRNIIWNNIWNTTPAPGTNIIGGPYLGGNYWSDYDGKDTDGDGLGDTLLPYQNCLGEKR